MRKNAYLHASLEFPFQGIPFDCCDPKDSDVSSVQTSLDSRATQVIDIFGGKKGTVQKGVLADDFQNDEEPPQSYRFVYRPGTPNPVPVFNSMRSGSMLKARGFFTPKHFLDHVTRVESPLETNFDQLRLDINKQDPFFYEWLHDQGQLGLLWLHQPSALRANKDFARDWGKSQAQTTAAMVDKLIHEWPSLALRFYFHRNNPEAILIAKIQLDLIKMKRKITQAVPSWLRDFMEAYQAPQPAEPCSPMDFALPDKAN